MMLDNETAIDNQSTANSSSTASMIGGHHSAFRLNRGFSLIELLTVIAILGILIAILVPTIGTAMDNARKSTAQSNLRQIALAYRAFANQGGRPRSINATGIHDWARTLAQEVDFNDPTIYILNDDPLVEREVRPLPVSIAALPNESATEWKLTPEFENYPLSFAVANRVSSQANPSTTPIAWTRGLRPDGSWSSSDTERPGVYGSEGGFVAFLDGHVVWYRNLSDEGGRLMNYRTRQPTASIQEALNPGAEVLDSFGTGF